jgi:beta-1,4-mannosyl-glycoprotein beta-1,4-N-acetylglucosaminyltransferase
MLIPLSFWRLRKRLYKTVLLHWKPLSIGLLFLWLFSIFAEHNHTFTKHAHAITSRSYELEKSYLPSPDNTPGSNLDVRASLADPQAQEFCAQHAFQPYPDRYTLRKVYDLFVINDELDWLEIRLDTLAAQVDYFVIVECAYTSTGLPKPLVLKENWARFAAFHSQIIYHEVTDMPAGAKETWDYDNYQRNALYLQVIPGLRGKEAARIGDILIVSDVDEIPIPTAITVMRNCEFPNRLTLQSQFFYYGFQWRHHGEEWAHPQATIYRGPGRTILPADLRNGEGGSRLTSWWHKANLWNSGWHCSLCFQNISEVLTKMSGLSHTPYDKEEFRDRTHIVDRVRKGLDIFDRPREKLIRVHNNQDIPGYIDSNRYRFRYLLDRDAWNAGFLDYGEDESAPD